MTGIGRRHIASGITGRHRGTHITIRSQCRSRHIHAPGFSIGIHRGLVGLGTHGDRHRITGFDVVINLTGHHNGLARLAGINHVIRRDIIDSNRRGGRHRIDTVRVAGIGRRHVARRIAGGDRGTDITIGSQHRSRNIHDPGFAIHIHRGLVGLGTDGNRYRIAGFHVIVDATGHRDGLARLAGVNHVIGRDIVDSNRRGGRHRIDTVSVSRIGGGDIACSITRRDRGRDIPVRSQHRSRHIHAPGFAIHIHRGLVGLGAHGDRHRIARFHVVIDVTADRDGLPGFSSVNHVIAGDIVDRDRGNWRNGIHAVSMTGISGGDITRRITRGDRRRNITVRR